MTACRRDGPLARARAPRRGRHDGAPARRVRRSVESRWSPRRPIPASLPRTLHRFVRAACGGPGDGVVPSRPLRRRAKGAGRAAECGVRPAGLARRAVGRAQERHRRGLGVGSRPNGFVGLDELARRPVVAGVIRLGGAFREAFGRGIGMGVEHRLLRPRAAGSEPRGGDVVTVGLADHCIGRVGDAAGMPGGASRPKKRGRPSRRSPEEDAVGSTRRRSPFGRWRRRGRWSAGARGTLRRPRHRRAARTSLRRRSRPPTPAVASAPTR